MMLAIHSVIYIKMSNSLPIAHFAASPRTPIPLQLDTISQNVLGFVDRRIVVPMTQEEVRVIIRSHILGVPMTDLNGYVLIPRFAQINTDWTLVAMTPNFGDLPRSFTHLLGGGFIETLPKPFRVDFVLYERRVIVPKTLAGALKIFRAFLEDGILPFRAACCRVDGVWKFVLLAQPSNEVLFWPNVA